MTDDASLPLAMQIARSDDARRERVLIRRAQAGDPHALQALVDQVTPVLHHLARRYSRGPQDLDDLAQVGALAAVKAIRRFQFERNVRLASYLVPTVTGELRRHVRDTSWDMRIPRDLQEIAWRIPHARNRLREQLRREPEPAEVAAELRVSATVLRDAETARELGRMGSLTQASGAVDPGACALDPGYGRCADRAELSAAMRTLQPRERVAVGMAYLEERSQREIGATLGCSQMQVSRILNRAIAKLRAALGQEPPQRAAA